MYCWSAEFVCAKSISYALLRDFMVPHFVYHSTCDDIQYPQQSLQHGLATQQQRLQTRVLWYQIRNFFTSPYTSDGENWGGLSIFCSFKELHIIKRSWPRHWTDSNVLFECDQVFWTFISSSVGEAIPTIPPNSQNLWRLVVVLSALGLRVSLWDWQ